MVKLEPRTLSQLGMQEDRCPETGLNCSQLHDSSPRGCTVGASIIYF